MDFENIKAWLDDIVDTIEHLNSLSTIGTSIIGAASVDSYLIHKGIDVVADVMGIPMEEKELESPSYFTKERRFCYRGIEFYDYTGAIPDGED